MRKEDLARTNVYE